MTRYSYIASCFIFTATTFGAVIPNDPFETVATVPAAPLYIPGVASNFVLPTMTVTIPTKTVTMEPTTTITASPTTTLVNSNNDAPSATSSTSLSTSNDTSTPTSAAAAAAAPTIINNNLAAPIKNGTEEDNPTTNPVGWTLINDVRRIPVVMACDYTFFITSWWWKGNDEWRHWWNHVYNPNDEWNLKLPVILHHKMHSCFEFQDLGYKSAKFEHFDNGKDKNGFDWRIWGRLKTSYEPFKDHRGCIERYLRFDGAPRDLYCRNRPVHGRIDQVVGQIWAKKGTDSYMGDYKTISVRSLRNESDFHDLLHGHHQFDRTNVIPHSRIPQHQLKHHWTFVEDLEEGMAAENGTHDDSGGLLSESN